MEYSGKRQIAVDCCRLRQSRSRSLVAELVETGGHVKGVTEVSRNRYFIVYIEEILVEDAARIYIREVFIRYRILTKIVLDRDLRFIVVF